MSRKEILVEEIHGAGLSIKTAAAYMGISERTMRNRLQDPDTLTVKELRNLQDVTGMGEKTILHIIRRER